MNNENLLKGKATQFKSGEEAARNGQKGGLQLGTNNRKRKAFREYIESELDKDIEIDGITITVKEAISIRLIEKILDDKINNKDFVKALEFVRDSIGEKPVDIVTVNKIDQSIIDEVEALVNETYSE